MALVAGAGVLARSLAALAAVDMGFKPERLLVLSTQFPLRSFDEAPRAAAFYRDLLVEVRALPGVTDARTFKTREASLPRTGFASVTRPSFNAT